MRSKSILIITDYFPPRNHIGSQRNWWMAQDFARNGWKVFVICSANTEEKGPEFSGTVHRVPHRAFLGKANFDRPTNRWWHLCKALWNKIFLFFQIDEGAGFYQPAFEAALQLIKQEKIDFLVTSFAPLSCLRVGLSLKKRFPHLYWVSDLRDEVSFNFLVSPLVRWRLRRYDRAMAQSADLITAVSKPLIEDYFTLGRNESDTLEVRNGYSGELDTSARSVSETVRMIYSGTVYGKRYPEKLFRAFEEILSENPSFPLEITFLGNPAPVAVSEKLRKHVRTIARVPHQEAQQFMRQSDVFLLVQPTSARKGIYTGKLFEYLSIQRPIFALVDPTDVAADLIRDCRAGWIVDSEDQAGIKEKLLEMVQLLTSGQTLQRNWELVSQHHRSVQNQKLIHRLEKEIQK